MTAKKAKKSASGKAKKTATAKKATAKKAPVRIAIKPKKKRAAAAPKTKPKTAVAPKAKTSAAPKTKTKTKTKALVAKKRVARLRSDAPKVPPARPSDRAMAVVAQLPQERALTDEEREAMAKCAQTAHAVLAALAGGDGERDEDRVPEAIVSSIGGFVDDIRMGRRAEPSSQDIRLGLGVLWGEQVRAQVGWRWVHLSYPNGFASYAVVPDDRAFACFPLNRLTELMRAGAGLMNTSVPLFDSIRTGALPARRENAYLVIG